MSLFDHGMILFTLMSLSAGVWTLQTRIENLAAKAKEATV